MATKQIGTPRTLIHVDYNDLDNLVNEVYPSNRPYEFVAYQEAYNGSSYEFNVRCGLDEWSAKKWRDMQQAGWEHYSAHIILDKLCEDGYIEPGQYLVEVDW